MIGTSERDKTGQNGTNGTRPALGERDKRDMRSGTSTTVGACPVCPASRSPDCPAELAPGYVYRDGRGSRLVLERVEPYLRRDGRESNVFFWRGECAECGAPFAVSSSHPSSARNLGRMRCDAHKWVFGTKRRRALLGLDEYDMPGME